MKYYYVTKVSNVISSLGSSKKVPNKVGYVEITKAQYDNYMDIINSIPERSGYIKKITLYIDGTYDVEYTEIVGFIDEE